MPVQKKSLQIFDNKKKRRIFMSSVVKRNQKATEIDDINLSVSRTRGLLLYGASEITDTDEILYGNNNKQDAEEIAGSDNTDDKKNDFITDLFYDQDKLAPMDDMIRNMMGYLTRGGSLFTDSGQNVLNVNRPNPSNSGDSNPSEI